MKYGSPRWLYANAVALYFNDEGTDDLARVRQLRNLVKLKGC